MFPDPCTSPFAYQLPVACAPVVGRPWPRRRMGLGFAPFQYGARFDSFVNRSLYGVRNGVLSGIGVGGVLGALAGFTAASNPITGIALAATGGLIGGTGGAILGGLLGLGGAPRRWC